MLTKKLVRHGNSLALVIDKPILEMLNIDETTELNVMSDGKRLLVEPQPVTVEEVEMIAREGMSKYGRMMRNLSK